VPIVVGLVVEALEGLQNSNYSAQDIARYVMAVGGLAGSYFLSGAISVIAETFGIAATPLAIKSVMKMAKAKGYFPTAKARAPVTSPSPQTIRPSTSVTTY